MSRLARYCVLLLFVGCWVLVVRVNGAYVDVADPCPLPNPVLPPDAGEGVARNPNMEEGFTNGAANQWVAWKDAQFSGQVHYVGDDRASQGSFSQKFILPQPPPGFHDVEAGLYQQIFVVPGETYTASMKVFLFFPPQSYQGEDLIAGLGLDPFGEASGDGYGMIWSGAASLTNQWVTLTVSAQAVHPVMTVGLKVTRKWPQHGNGALAWLDQVTFSGPIPTGPRPTPEVDPIDPETLIPATTGPNLVQNPSFERTFVDGVSSGWSAWVNYGTGRWRRSTLVGKVGGGRYDCGSMQAMVDMNPKTILLYGGDPERGLNGTYGDSNFLNSFPHMDNTIVIGRPAIDHLMGGYLANPVVSGRRLADLLYNEQREWPRIDCWQALNEPDWGGGWQNVISFEKAFADRAHELGMKTCSLNLSTGSPGNIWRMVDQRFNPSCRDLLAVADYLGQHCYGGPNDDIMVTNQVRDDVCAYAMRPRRFWDMYNRRGWRFPPVIATEGSTWGGSVDYWGPTRMANDLVAMGRYMNVNRWWCGYTNFVVGGSCGWGGFEIADKPSIIAAVGAANAAAPADAMDGLYSQMFGAGQVHPKTLAELTPAGLFDGGICQRVDGLTTGKTYLLIGWMKYEFRGRQPIQLQFRLGVDSTGQTTDGSAATIDWSEDQIPDKAPIHEIFSHVWRTFTAGGTSASIWLRASHPVSDPSFMVYVDQVEVRALTDQQPSGASVIDLR